MKTGCVRCICQRDPGLRLGFLGDRGTQFRFGLTRVPGTACSKLEGPRVILFRPRTDGSSFVLGHLCARQGLVLPFEKLLLPELVCFPPYTNPTSGEGGGGSSPCPSDTILRLLARLPAACGRHFKWRNCKPNVTGKLNICHLLRRGL